LWASDPELAAVLNAIPGNNFFWRNSAFAKPDTCTGDSLVSTSGVNVGRSMTSIGNTNNYAGKLFGTDALRNACIAPGTDAYVHREVFTTTYTDTNTRLYVFTANKALRSQLTP
jgi:hypothetical protein